MRSIHLSTTRCEGMDRAVYIGGRTIALHAGLKSRLLIGQNGFTVNNNKRSNR